MELKPGEESTAPNLKTNAPLFRWRTQHIGNAVVLADNNTEHAGTAPVNGHGEVQKTPVVKLGNEVTQDLRSLPAHATLADVASVLRSKNSGPFEITFDVMFENEHVYRIIKESQMLSSKLMENLYELKPEEILWCGWFDQARAWKATIPRKRHGMSMAGGGFMENDIHGSQQYVPLLDVKFPEETLGRLRQVGEVAHPASL